MSNHTKVEVLDVTDLAMAPPSYQGHRQESPAPSNTLLANYRRILLLGVILIGYSVYNLHFNTYPTPYSCNFNFIQLPSSPSPTKDSVERFVPNRYFHYLLFLASLSAILGSAALTQAAKGLTKCRCFFLLSLILFPVLALWNIVAVLFMGMSLSAYGSLNVCLYDDDHQSYYYDPLTTEMAMLVNFISTSLLLAINLLLVKTYSEKKRQDKEEKFFKYMQYSVSKWS